MTLETRCSTPAGRAGHPCSVLAAVLLEVDRRGLLSGVHDQTPITLDVVADDAPDDVADSSADDPATDGDGSSAGDEESARAAGDTPAWTPPESPRRGSPRLPPWAADLEDRRRLVEPAVRSHALVIPDQRRAGGTLVFVLDLAASADARAAVIVPARMQLDCCRRRTKAAPPAPCNGRDWAPAGDIDAVGRRRTRGASDRRRSQDRAGSPAAGTTPAALQQDGEHCRSGGDSQPGPASTACLRLVRRRGDCAEHAGS
jgi:hypothetical protein